MHAAATDRTRVTSGREAVVYSFFTLEMAKRLAVTLTTLSEQLLGKQHTVLVMRELMCPSITTLLEHDDTEARYR